MYFIDELYNFLSDTPLTDADKGILINYANKLITSNVTIDDENVDKHVSEILSDKELLEAFVELINAHALRELKDSMDDIELYEAGVH